MQDRLGWIVGALASFGLAVSCLILGRNLMPTMAEMQSKLGSVAPLIIAWSMIWTTAVIGFILAIVLLVTGLGKTSEAHYTPQTR
jgi:hypothetical protein